MIYFKNVGNHSIFLNTFLCYFTKIKEADTDGTVFLEIYNSKHA